MIFNSRDHSQIKKNVNNLSLEIQIINTLKITVKNICNDVFPKHSQIHFRVFSFLIKLKLLSNYFPYKIKLDKLLKVKISIVFNIDKNIQNEF